MYTYIQEYCTYAGRIIVIQEDKAYENITSENHQFQYLLVYDHFFGERGLR